MKCGLILLQRWLYNIIETFRPRQTMTHLTVNADEEDTEMGQRKCIESKGSNFACRIRDHGNQFLP